MYVRSGTTSDERTSCLYQLPIWITHQYQMRGLNPWRDESKYARNNPDEHYFAIIFIARKSNFGSTIFGNTMLQNINMYVWIVVRLLDVSLGYQRSIGMHNKTISFQFLATLFKNRLSVSTHIVLVRRSHQSRCTGIITFRREYNVKWLSYTYCYDTILTHFIRMKFQHQHARCENDSSDIYFASGCQPRVNNIYWLCCPVNWKV